MSSASAGVPEWVTAYNITYTSLVVKWSHVPRKYFGRKPIGYKIYYICLMDGSDFPFVIASYTTNTITLTNLRVYTRYYIGVATVSSGGDGLVRRIFVSTGENSKLVHFSKMESFIHCSSFTC